MERKFKQRWSTIPSTSTRRTTTSDLKSMKQKRRQPLKISLDLWLEVPITLTNHSANDTLLKLIKADANGTGYLIKKYD
jgi:hypothetical protein